MHLDPPSLLAVLRQTGAPPADASPAGDLPAAFDRLTRLAALVLQSPVALVNLVDGGRELCVSAYDPSGGYSAQSESSLDSSLCVHAVTSREPLVIENAAEHPLAVRIPAVRAGRIGAYLGIPLVTSEGQAIGTLCVLDDAPREWDPAQVELLSDLAESVLTELELQRSATVLRESEARYRSLFHGASEGFCLVERDASGDMRYTEVNARLAAFAEMPPERILGSRPAEMWPADAAEAVSALYLEAFENGVQSELELSVRLPRGAATARLKVCPIVQGDQRVDRVLGIVEDVTQSRSIDAIRREHHALLHAIIEGTPDAVFAKDLDGRYLLINSAGARFLGTVPAEIVGKTDAEFLPADVAAVFQTSDRQVLAATEALTGEETGVVGGAMRTFFFNKAPIRDADGEVIGTVGVSRDVTERNQAEQALRKSQAELAGIIELASDAIVSIDAAGRIVLFNRAAELSFGRSAEEVRGEPLSILLPAPARDGSLDELRRLTSAGSTPAIGQRTQIQGLRKDGSEFPIEMSISRLDMDDDRLYTLVLQDISERRRVETERDRESERRDELTRQLEIERRRLFRVLEQAPAFIATVRGPEHVFEMANPSYHHLVGHRELLGRRVRDALPEVADQGILDILDEVYLTGQPFVATGLPMLLRRTAGGALEERILDFVYQPLEEADGSVSGILVHGVDVSEQALAKQRTAEAEAHYRRLVTTSPQVIFAVGSEGSFTEVNSAGASLLGRTTDALIGLPFADVVHPFDLPAVTEQFGRLTARETEAVEVELRVVRPTKESRLIVVNAVPIDDGGDVIGFHGVARDITDERRREEQMRLLTTVLESLEAGVSIIDDELRVVYANAACARLLGCPPGEYRSRDVSLMEFMPDEASVQQLAEIARVLADTGQWSGRIWRRRQNSGEVVPLDALVGTVAVEGDSKLSFTVMHDATSTEEAERQLRRVERLASVGTLISGVAHELNNPLHAIRGLAELLLMGEEATDRREDLEVVRREADRMAKIVADLRQVARDADEEPTSRGEADLNHVVERALQSREYSLSTHNVQVTRELAQDLPPISGERTQLEQMVMNLIINAEQAMEDQDSERRITIRTRASERGALLEVSDTGPGIPEEHLERIFDPFWTTRDPGTGSGLGLSLVHSTVADCGGEVRVQSEPGAGAVFQIDLPGPTPPPSTAPVAEDPPSGLRVLVVDDESANRRLLARGLAQRGHRTDEAGEGGAALRLLETAEYDVIVSDLRMPGLSGELLMRELQADGRGLDRRLIVVTGDVSDSRTARSLEEAGVPVFVKPIGLDELASAIESLAASRKAEG